MHKGSQLLNTRNILLGCHKWNNIGDNEFSPALLVFVIPLGYEKKQHNLKKTKGFNDKTILVFSNQNKVMPL